MTGADHHDDANFVLVINAIVTLFSTDRKLMENRGSLIVRKLCVLLNAQQVYIHIAVALTSLETKVDPSQETGDAGILEFISTTAQILNLLLLTAPELHSLRQMLRSGPERGSGVSGDTQPSHVHSSVGLKNSLFTPKNSKKLDDYSNVFSALFRCWCHNYIAAFSLCLIAQRYDVAFALVKKFSDMDVTVGFLMQVDKLVHLLESPIFIHLRLQLLDVESPNHVYLLKSCYGLLMLLPQSDAFRSLNDRLTAVCNLRDNLAVPTIEGSSNAMKTGRDTMTQDTDTSHGSFASLLDRFDTVIAMHDAERRRKETELSSSEAGNTPQRPSPAVSTQMVPRGTPTTLPEAHNSSGNSEGKASFI
jgi:vacuole morphology and inheritance protein 14